MLLFLNSACGACRRFADELRSDRGRELVAQIRLTVVTDATGADAFVDLDTSGVGAQEHGEAVTALGIPATPYGVAIAVGGAVLAADLVADLDSLYGLAGVLRSQPVSA